MLRVLMTVDAVGGVWRYALDLTRSLAAFEVTVLLVGFGPPPDPRQLAECDTLLNVELTWIDEPLDWTVACTSVLAAGTDRLAALAQQWRADLLHLNAPSQAAGLDCAQPVVAVSHSCVPTWWHAVRGAPLADDWAWHLERNRQGLDRADIVVVPSESHRQAVARIYGSDRPFRVAYNAVPPVSAAAARQPLIVSVGRWWDDGKNGGVLDAAAPASPWPIVLAGPLTGPHGQAVHFAHVEGHDHPLFSRGAHQRVGDACASAEGDDRDVVRVGCRDDDLHVGVRAGVDHHIRYTLAGFVP